MKVLFIIDSLVYGGAQRQLVELAKGLQKKDMFEIHIISLTNKTSGYYDIIEKMNIPLKYYPRLFKYDIFFPLIRIIKYIIMNKIDIIHTFMNMGSLFGCIAGKITNRKVVCCAIRDAKDKKKNEKYLKKFLPYISDIFVSNSKAGFLNRYNIIKPHFKVIFNGVDFSRFENINNYKLSKLKNELGIINSYPILGMVGRLSNHKDQETLIKSIPFLLNSFPHIKLLIIGDGPKRYKLENLVKKLNIEKQVIFTGFRNDVEYIYPLMDIYVLLTNENIHNEGISNSIIEAMASGIPVIASSGGGTPEIIKNMETGILVPSKDIYKTTEAVIKLLNNKKLYNKISKQANIFVRKNFNLERYVNDYINIYTEILNNETVNKRKT